MKSIWLWIGVVVLAYLVANFNSSKPPRHNTYTSPPAEVQEPKNQAILENLEYPLYFPAATFKGYECNIDCSGHEAGYEWAEDNDIDDPDKCDGNSDSFIEGCRSYAEEQEDTGSDFQDFDEE